MLIGINKSNVGRIAERVVSNELEFRGFRVSDLNKEGTSANADVIAAKDGRTWQIQVKGSSWDRGYWVHYGYCSEALVTGKKRMFNAVSDSFYKAGIVVLISVKSPSDYKSVVLPTEVAENAAQLNLDYAYRTPTRLGAQRKPSGPVWVSIGYVPEVTDPFVKSKMTLEQQMLQQYFDNWDLESAVSGLSVDPILNG
jgi:hypothetical protein